MPVGVVISSGRALKTIRVRIPVPFWESHIRKTFTRFQTIMVHDEKEACIEGDVVRIEPGCVTSNSKRHMVAEIISPVLTAEPREPVETHEEWLARKKAKRAAKEERRLRTRPWKWVDSQVLSELKPEIWLKAKEKYSPQILKHAPEPSPPNIEK